MKGRTMVGAVVLALGAIGVRAVTDEAPASITYVIAWDGPSTSGRGADQVHYVTCVDAANPEDMSSSREVFVDAADAYPIPETGRHRYSAGEPCPEGRVRT